LYQLATYRVGRGLALSSEPPVSEFDQRFKSSASGLGVRLNVGGKLAICVAVLAILVSNIGLSQVQRWTLPAPDSGDAKPSPPSVHGYLVAAATQSVKLERDSRDASASTIVDVRLTAKTEFFSAYGGAYTPDELRSGQYVWVWYVTANPAKAGVPPRAAVVMLWSKNPMDKPSPKVRWRFDRHK
jgi:hypothetical protein